MERSETCPTPTMTGVHGSMSRPVRSWRIGAPLVRAGRAAAAGAVAAGAAGRSVGGACAETAVASFSRDFCMASARLRASIAPSGPSAVPPSTPPSQRTRAPPAAGATDR
nr:hypothetical protein GCM10020092_074510 [Actinoplanes digitatis]